MNRVVAVQATQLHSHHRTAVHPPFVSPSLAVDDTRNYSMGGAVQHGSLLLRLDKGNGHELGARPQPFSDGDRRPYPSSQLEGCKNWPRIRVHSKLDGYSTARGSGPRETDLKPQDERDTPGD
jgi:hypothetical protein